MIVFSFFPKIFDANLKKIFLKPIFETKKTHLKDSSKLRSDPISMKISTGV